MPDCRLVVVSCPRYKPIQELWWKCQQKHWPDCPYPIDILSPENDVGWNANLLNYLDTVSEPLTLLLLDDHFIEPGNNTANINAALELMERCPDIGMIKVQAGNAAPPELPCPEWDRLGEYDRKHHPFKRTNLVPTLFRRHWLQRLAASVLAQCGPEVDKGRTGALAFEGVGTMLTMDAAAWPERMLGIHRPFPGYSCAGSLLSSIGNDGVREGRLQHLETIGMVCNVTRIPGIEAFI